MKAPVGVDVAPEPPPGPFYVSLATPLGFLTVFEAADAVVAVEWGRTGKARPSPLLMEAKRQLDAYFDRRLKRFELPLAPAGSRFQRAVWDCMRAIPYGEARTYGELAKSLASVARAVGGACGRNPVPIIIPCHRVVGQGGRLGGYSGGDGLATKRALLAFEGYLLA